MLASDPTLNWATGMLKKPLTQHSCQAKKKMVLRSVTSGWIEILNPRPAGGQHWNPISSWLCTNRVRRGASSRKGNQINPRARLHHSSINSPISPNQPSPLCHLTVNNGQHEQRGFTNWLTGQAIRPTNQANHTLMDSQYSQPSPENSVNIVNMFCC